MSTNGHTNGHEPIALDDGLQETFSSLSKLERDFAAVELNSLRQKEYSLRQLYKNRHNLTTKIPDFWPTVLSTAASTDEPEDPLNLLEDPIVASVRSLQVERYQIESEKEGEPRSLRFIFEFEPNDLFEDTTVIKDFEYRVAGDETGGFVSEPVTFKWKKAAKTSGKNKLLDAAVDLYKAEQALKSDSKIEIEKAEREGLWQYQKLDEAIQKSQEEDGELSLLDWFGFRGAVNMSATAEGDAEMEDEDDEDDSGMLDVEIFPAGEELAIALAEELWPNVMDVFISAQDEDDDLDDMSEDSDEESVPELIDAEEVEEAEAKPPKKKQRKA